MSQTTSIPKENQLPTERRKRRRKLEDPGSFPKRFEVQIQARVRSAMDLQSEHVTDLPEGSVVTVEEIVDRRARISKPLHGWLSVTSKFGAKIIMPTTAAYSKIGGKVTFKRKIAGQPTKAKVTDYNEDNGLYKIVYDDNTSQWLDLNDPNIDFISQHQPVKVHQPLNPNAATFTLQGSEEFFNQFFCIDYPEYQAQSSSSHPQPINDIHEVKQPHVAAAAHTHTPHVPPQRHEQQPIFLGYAEHLHPDQTLPPVHYQQMAHGRHRPHGAIHHQQHPVNGHHGGHGYQVRIPPPLPLYPPIAAAGHAMYPQQPHDDPESASLASLLFDHIEHAQFMACLKKCVGPQQDHQQQVHAQPQPQPRRAAKRNRGPIPPRKRNQGYQPQVTRPHPTNSHQDMMDKYMKAFNLLTGVNRPYNQQQSGCVGRRVCKINSF